MATERDTSLILSISADVRQVQRALQKMEQDTGRSTKNVERQFERMGREVDRTVKGSFARVNQTIAGFGAGFARGAGGALLAGFSIQGAQRYIDAATRIQNALKVAGVEGDNLTKVYDRLFVSAQKNAAPLETMVTLYSRVAQAQDSLGVSQEQILNFTDKIGVALRVAGTSAQEASGALLQLGQALGSGTVRAEEFNSINEGARPILQAVAAGLKEAGGSVATLRNLVLDGAVSSEAFFRAFEAGASTLEEKVKSAELTVSQQFTRLQNVLIDVAGRINDVTGASDRVGAGFERLSGIIEGVGRVIEAIANGPVGRMISRMEELNNVLRQFEPLSRGLSLLTGENLDAAADALTGNPEPKGLSAQIAAKQAELAQLQEESTSAYDFASREKIKDLQSEISELQQDLRNAKDKEQLYIGAAAAGAGGAAGGLVRNPVSLSDYPVGGAGGGSGAAAKMIRKFEGFRERAYFDVDAFRTGFGSDTATRANGMIEKVTKDTIVTLEDAERDLARRIVEFQTGIQNAIGIEKWKSLSEAQQAALTSIAYNYGSIGSGGANIAKIVQEGTAAEVAKAIASLSANPARRREEAQAYLTGTGTSLTEAGITSGSGRAKRSPDDIFKGSVEEIQQRISLINAEMEAQRGLAVGVDDYGYAVEKATIKQQLLNDAKKAGLTITPELAASIDQLAENYARASSNAEQLAAQQQLTAQQSQEMGSLMRDAVGGFISDLKDGKSAAEALSNALSRVADRLLDIALDNLFTPQGGGGVFGGGGGLFGGAGKGGLFGGALIPGILHKGGVAGQDGYGHGRSMSSSVFAGAQRYHQGGVAGLRPGEVPAILEKGEIVLPKMPNSRSSRGPQQIELIVRAEEGQMFRPTIQAEARGVAVNVTQAGINSYDKNMPGRVNEVMERNGR